MTVTELVTSLKENQHRADAIARIIGYVAMIQHMGWDELPMNRISKYNLEKTFRLLGIDPHDIKF